MKTKTIKRKNILSVLAVLVMLMAMLLTACGSSQAAVPTPETETTEVENVKEEVTELAESVEPEVAEEVVETEPTAEPTLEPEVSKYEGIDMESTLPGIEWLDTFDGIINEPKLVVFNDDTNKKVIVENGDTIEFSLTDTMATYVPADKESCPKYLISRCFKNYECVGRYTIETELQSEIDKVGVTFNYSNIIIYGDDEVKLTAEIKIVE